MDSPTATLIGILKDRVASLRFAGDLKEALHASNAAVEKCQQALGTDPETIDAFASALEIRGDIQRELGRPESARDDYAQAIDQLENRPDRLDRVGCLHAAMGAAYDAMGRRDKARDHWLEAIGYFEKCEPPLWLDIATISNNLGYLSKTGNDLDKAESHFLRALEITHSQLGQEHEQTAAISSNLGALYQAAGYREQAREMHMMALETRRKLLGEDHPDTAQSHNNLALALLSTGDRSWARRHFERALASFEALGPEYVADLEAVAANYCDFLRDEGEMRLADIIAGRVRQVVGGVGSASGKDGVQPVSKSDGMGM